jgi:HlyD family secretion protein
MQRNKQSLSKAGIRWQLLLLIPALVISQQAQAQAVSALGRLEPENGVLHIGVSSSAHAVSGSIIAELLVEEGDWVEKGQLLAITDSTEMMRASARKTEAELKLAGMAAEAAKSRADEACTLADFAAKESARRASLLEQQLTSEEESEQAQGEAEAKAASCTAAHANARVAASRIEVAHARMAIDEIEIERSMVRAPVAGRVLDVHTRPGEMAGAHSVLDLGRTDHMFAIAEVYETDIATVKVGQKAHISSDALSETLTGTVERIRGMVQKNDVIGTDPAARKDARIIEVEIRLDDSKSAEALTNLQVEVIIGG